MSYASPSRVPALLTALLFLAAPLVLLAPAQAQPAPAPAGTLDWVAAWLGSQDKNGNLVEDDAEAAAAADPAGTVGVLVTFRHVPSDADRAALAGLGAGAMYTFEAIPTINTVVPAGQVASLGGLDGVAAVEWDRPMFANLDISSPATQATRLVGGGGAYDGFTAEDLGYTGEGILVAVADTGVNEFHEAFEPGGTKFVGGADSTAIEPPTCGVQGDEALHGSHVAATAVGNPPNAMRGTAFDANLFEMKIGSAVSLGGIDRAYQFILKYNAAIDAGAPLCPLVTQKIDVVTLSFGSHSRGGPNAGSTEPLVTALVQSGVVVTIAAGNCGPQGDTTLCSTLDDESIIDSPGNAAGAITVANSDDHNTITRSDDNIDASSSRGPNSATTSDGDPSGAEGATGAANLKDRHRKPDLSAPGTDITAALGLTPNQYISLSGTSMATPHVAGIAALLLEAGEKAKAQTGGVNLMRPRGTGFDANGAYVEGVHPVKDALYHSADYKTAGVPAAMLAKWEGPGADGLLWNNGWGYGHVNAFGALCWAWQNVLIPGGATPPQAVTDKCFTTPPLTASAGGPYNAFVGQPETLLAGASGGQLPYSFAWDLDNDGLYDDASGSSASFTSAVAGTFPVAVQVTDAAATVATAAATVAVRVLPDEVLVATYAFDGDATTCQDKQGWWDAVGAATSVPPLVPGAPWHLTPLSAQGGSGCSWYGGIDGVNLYYDNGARNLWGPCMTLPPGVAGGRWDFQLAGQSEATFDFLYARVNKGCLTEQAPGVPVAAGTSAPVVVGVFDGKHGDIATGVYEQVSLSLDEAVIGGGPFQIGFRFESDLLIEDQGFWLDDFQLRLRDSAPSVAVDGSTAGDEGSVLAFVVRGEDPEGDPVTLRAEGLPEGATFDPALGLFAWTPPHAAIGAHDVTFVASDGLLESRTVVTVEVRNLAPTAAGSADQEETDRLTPVQFTDASVDPNGGSVVAWAWDFQSDGVVDSTLRDPTYTYPTLGTKEVRLTVTDEHGASATALVDIVKVKNVKPKARAEGDGGNGNGNGGGQAQNGEAIVANRLEPVRFQDQSTDPDGSVSAWSWTFGDGATSTQQDPDHQYTALGAFTVQLTATDNDGDSDVTSRIVEVVNLLPSSDFAVQPAHPLALTPTSFESLAADLDGSVVAWAWEFGDGATSTQEDPVHVYLNGGTYTVRLTVTDNDGGVRSLARDLYVCMPGADVGALADFEHVRLEFEACLHASPETLPL